MSDTETPAAPTQENRTDRSRTGVFIALSAGGLVVLAALVSLVLVVSLGVIQSSGLPTAAAKRVLLTENDLAGISGVEIATGLDGEVRTRSLQSYVKANPGDTSHTVTPANCADNLEGWMAWKSLDTPSYRGWKTDTIYEASNILVDSTTNYENGLQEARHFTSVGAATAFMNAQRGWYKTCAHTSYSDPQDPRDDSAFTFSPIPVNLGVGVDAIVEGSNNTGRGLPPHLIDVYMRNKNIVYVTELVTKAAPQHGMDRVSLMIVKTAAKKLAALR